MIQFLTVDQVIEINKQVIRKFKSNEQIGVKDFSLLESAVYRPQQSLFGEDAYKSIWDRSAALFESIGKNHAFHNGNKRTAIASLIIFLYMNGIEFKMEQKDAENFTVEMVKGKYSFKEISRIIELNSNMK